MVLFLLNSGDGQPPHSGIVSAWETVAEQQGARAPAYWLVSQPDHATLAGDLAANFSSPDFPVLDADVVRAIALHDTGWAEFDGSPMRDRSGRPLSFLQVAPKDFVRAWKDSIEAAEQDSLIGGLMVSGHFRRLAGNWLKSGQGEAEDKNIVRSFLSAEDERERRLVRQQSRSRDEIEKLIDVLQFCDLLSLYLCCGARSAVSFPQRIADRNVVLQRHGEACVLHPSPFGKGVSLGVPARRDPISAAESDATTLPVILK
jgi:hypothetical protein